MNNHNGSKKSPRKHREEAVVRHRFFAVSICCVSLAGVLGIAALALHLFGDAVALPIAPDLTADSSQHTEVPKPVVTTVRFSASGDNLLHEGLYLQAKARGENGAYDFAALYENIAAFYQDYDVNWINQETLLTDEFPPSGYPTFCSPTAVASALYDIGFRVFALSNNHSYDKGAAGIDSTLSFWNTMPDDTLFPGFYASESDYTNLQTHTVNNITIAYLPYTEHTNGIPTPGSANANIIYTSQTDVIEAQIKHARTIADVIIPTVHWGTEDSPEINSAQRALAQQMADWGADVIIGTHPHVVQPVEMLTTATSGKQVPVFYSLGNFVSLQNKANNLIEIVGTFTITKTKQPDGAAAIAISEVDTHPLVMHYEENYRNARVYWAKDYTKELLQRHGNKQIEVNTY